MLQKELRRSLACGSQDDHVLLLPFLTPHQWGCSKSTTNPMAWKVEDNVTEYQLHVKTRQEHVPGA